MHLNPKHFDGIADKNPRIPIKNTVYYPTRYLPKDSIDYEWLIVFVRGRKFIWGFDTEENRDIALTQIDNILLERR